MSSRQFSRALLLASALALLGGFAFSWIWTLGGLIGLVPAITWLVNEIRSKTIGSDLLAVLALAGAILTNQLFAAAVISVMLATGRVLESWAEGQAERQLKALLSRMPRTVHRMTGDGKIEEIAIVDVAIGDRLLIRSGEIAPTDGTLLKDATLDEAALTGEPLPVSRVAGEEINSGVLNAGAPFEYLATTTSADSTYAGIIKLVRQAQAKSAPGVRLANQWALRFVPLALVIAAGAWLISGEIDRAVAVLVAATPCPLILAVPIAVVSGLSKAAKNGAIIKGGGILELLARTETVLLDKTGTLTHGGPEISQIATAPGFSDAQVLQIAASVDQYSPHIVAKAIVREAKKVNLEFLPCEIVEEIAGKEISAKLAGSLYTVGQLKSEKPEWLTIDSPLMVAITRDEVLIGIFGLDDPIRSESKRMVSDLRTAGVQHIALVTGDRDETAQAVAESVGITEVYSKVTAAGKLEITNNAMRTAQGTVVVVGDGINDAPALAAAHVGVAMGAHGASAASEAADVVIVEDSIGHLTTAILIAKNSRKKALQAAGIGMSLSLLIMATGAMGVTNASEGAIAQEFIDIISILWALTAIRNTSDTAGTRGIVKP
jgi:heavy metal translocating P-type ATPase